ncbi:hypothetical protein [Cryobacterium sp. BB307]|uniref:hypothetical protein n=1 Tax=Cryobacterium sp. BB307 TaxID=2716317 RepID=UPI0014463B38|nr:hypothetical protein [Cryobacterium sp. BB307]
MTETIRTPDAAPDRVDWARVAIAAAFALLFAYDLFEAISDAIGVVTSINQINELAAEADVAPLGIPWAAIVVNLVLPVMLYVVGVIVGFKRGRLPLVLSLATALAVVAAVTLSVNVLAGYLT